MCLYTSSENIIRVFFSKFIKAAAFWDVLSKNTKHKPRGKVIEVQEEEADKSPFATDSHRQTPDHYHKPRTPSRAWYEARKNASKLAFILGLSGLPMLWSSFSWMLYPNNNNRQMFQKPMETMVRRVYRGYLPLPYLWIYLRLLHTASLPCMRPRRSAWDCHSGDFRGPPCRGRYFRKCWVIKTYDLKTPKAHACYFCYIVGLLVHIM